MRTYKTSIWIFFCIGLLMFSSWSCDQETPINSNNVTAGQTYGFFVTTLDTTIGLYLANFSY